MDFLNLCEIESKNVGFFEGFGYGIYRAENYSKANFRKREALLIEGIHQYSSLVAENVFGKHPDSVFIPVMIKSMNINKQVNLGEITLRGSVISSDDFIHVRTNWMVSNKISGGADVFLKKISLNNHPPSAETFIYGSDLFNILHLKKSPGGIIVKFKVNSFHHILKEHFRGYPVCPASLIIEFISDIVLNYGWNKNFNIENTKFLNPLVPCNEYELDIKFSESMVSFFITGPEKIRLTAGKLIYE